MEFASILVAHPFHRTTLVWINIWSAGAHHGEFATKVDDASVQRWHTQGWRDEYLFHDPREHGDGLQYALFESLHH